MSKKRPRRPRRRKKGASEQSTTQYNLETTIVINKGNKIAEPDRLVCLPGGPVTWLISNQDTETHTVIIDPEDFTHKSNGKHEHPLTKDDELIAPHIPAGGFGLITATVRKGLKVENYKYLIRSANDDDDGGVTGSYRDPDFDVVDPNSGTGD